MLATLNLAIKSQKCEFKLQITKPVKYTNQNYCFKLCIYAIYIHFQNYTSWKHCYFWTPSWKISGALATVHNWEYYTWSCLQHYTLTQSWWVGSEASEGPVWLTLEPMVFSYLAGFFWQKVRVPKTMATNLAGIFVYNKACEVQDTYGSFLVYRVLEGWHISAPTCNDTGRLITH